VTELRVLPEREGQPLVGLAREWLLDLKVLGRGERTIYWYRQKVEAFLRESQASTLAELTASEVKGHISGLQDRGLSDNTVHGVYETIKAFARWADREGYAVDQPLLRMRAPKVEQKDREVYTEAQQTAIFREVPAGWPTLAVQLLIGTGMRATEMCNLEVDDFEDDGDVAFLKVRRGKGKKFRRVPVSQRLRRELHRYLNRVRPETECPRLLVRRDGGPITYTALAGTFRRLRLRVGFPIHAHRFRHTFATEYIQREGDIERLRKILGHADYAMILRYVHLNKHDLAHDFDDRTPF
jgi:site-specific recombinase XerD